MTATETAVPTTLEGIRARLREIAPYPAPDDPAAAMKLARYMTVQGLRRNSRCLDTAVGPDVTLSMDAVSALQFQYAVVHLLAALGRGEAGPDSANVLSAEILGAWDDGAGIGEWLWEHAQALGIDPGEVNRLAEAEAALEVPLPARTDALRVLGGIVSEMSAGLYAAWIDLQRGDREAALKFIESMPAELRQRDGDAAWNGAETGAAWIDRTQAEPEREPGALYATSPDGEPYRVRM